MGNWLRVMWRKLKCSLGDHGPTENSHYDGTFVHFFRQYENYTCGWCQRRYRVRRHNPRPFGG